MTKFYIVFSPDGPSAPTVMHPKHKNACGAAWHMARQFPDQTFHVMATAGKPAHASRIEARSDATGTGAAEGESLIGAAETPNPLSHAEAKQPALSTGPTPPTPLGVGPTSIQGAE